MPMFHVACASLECAADPSCRGAAGGARSASIKVLGKEAGAAPGLSAWSLIGHGAATFRQALARTHALLESRALPKRFYFAAAAALSAAALSAAAFSAALSAAAFLVAASAVALSLAALASALMLSSRMVSTFFFAMAGGKNRSVNANGDCEPGAAIREKRMIASEAEPVRPIAMRRGVILMSATMLSTFSGEKKFGTSSWMAVLGAGPWKNR